MKVKFDSTFILNNFDVFQNCVTNFHKEKFILTREGIEKFEYDEEEFCLLIFKNLFFGKSYNDFFVKKRSGVNNETKLNSKIKEKKEKGNVYITNKNIYFDNKKFNKIKIEDIKEIEIAKNSLIIQTSEKNKKIIYTNSIEFNMYIALLIEMLPKFKLKKEMLNKSITLSASKSSKSIKK